MAGLTAAIFTLLIAFAFVVSANSSRLHRIAVEQSRRLYTADINRVKEAIDRGDLTLAQGIIQRYSSPERSKDYRGFEWYYLNDLCRLRDQSHVLPHDWAVNNIVYSRDGKQLATCELGGQLVLWDAITLKPVWRSSRQGPHFISVAFRRSGHELVTGTRDGTVHILDAATGNESQHRVVGRFEVFTINVRSSDGLVAFGKRTRFSNYPELASPRLLFGIRIVTRLCIPSTSPKRSSA